VTDEKKNGVGPYRTPEECEIEPEYRTTFDWFVLDRRSSNSGGPGSRWASLTDVQPAVPPEPYRWRLLSTEPVVLRTSRESEDGRMQVTVLLIWTWQRVKGRS
jgi:hypothetical protein